MLSVSSLGAVDPQLGLLPDLRLGTDYRMTSQGVAIAVSAEAMVLFRDIQEAVNRAANLFGMPGAITVDGKIGPVTAAAIKFTVGKFTDDLRGNVAPEARDGITSAIAKDARNVLGTLLVAIERKSAAPVIATPLAPTIKPPPFVLPTVIVQADRPAGQSVTESPAREARAVAPTTFSPAVKPGLPTAAWAGIGVGVLLLGVAVLSQRTAAMRSSTSLRGVVARIYNGYRLIVDGKEYATVVGSQKMRGKYYYILKDRDGKKTSLDREDLLALQKDGTIKVIDAKR